MPELAYTSPYTREKNEKPDDKFLILCPFSIQKIVYEIVVNHFLTNDPLKQGFVFKDKFNLDRNKSDIHIALANEFDQAHAQKRPALFIFRSAAQYKPMTIGGAVSADPMESMTKRLVIGSMSCGVACIATNVGFTEEVAEFVRRGVMAHQWEIECDFKFRRFRVTSITQPQIYRESKDHFIININMDIVFDENIMVKSDDLKIKTVSRTIFDRCTGEIIGGQ